MTPTPEPVVIEVLAHSSLGDILVGPDGFTLYVFDADEPGVSNCTGGCASTWPPLAVAGELAVAASVTAVPGTIDRDGGVVQGTLGGLPLYYFTGDSSPGDTNGHGVNGVWWAVTPDGTVASSAMEPKATELPPTPTPVADTGGGYDYG